MSNLREFPDPALVRQQTAEWIAKLSRGLTPAEATEFARWRRSPANARMLRRMSGLWNELNVMRALSDVFPEPPGTTPGGVQPETAPTTMRPWRGRAIAASLAAALLLAGAAFFVALRTDEHAAATAARVEVAPLPYSTAIGQHRDVALADGSSLAINTGSTVQVVALGDSSRELRLLKGEAHFTVAPDPSRPFRVTVGSRIVQAVGTAFNLRLDPDGRFELLVTEGRVALFSGDGSQQMLERGQLLDITPEGISRERRLDGDALAARLAWRDGMLVFEGESLVDALDEFSRYTDTRFVIGDPALREMRVGGFFPAGDTAVLLDTLSASLGIVARTGADGVVRLEAAGEPAPGD